VDGACKGTFKRLRTAPHLHTGKCGPPAQYNFSVVDSQATGPAALSTSSATIKVGNDIAHETAHDVMPGYHPDAMPNSRPDSNDVMNTLSDAGPKAKFSPEEAQRLRERYNDPGEVERVVPQQPEEETP